MGRTEEGGGIQIVQEDTELRNTGRYFFPPRSSSDPLKWAALLPSGSQGDMNIAICHSQKKLHLSDRLDQLLFGFFCFVLFCFVFFWLRISSRWETAGCAPRLSPTPSPAAGFTSIPSDSTNSPRQAQSKHCPLGRGSGCSPVVQGPGGPERNSPGPLLCCLGSSAGGTAACRRVIPGCKHVSPAPRPALLENTAT